MQAFEFDQSQELEAKSETEFREIYEGVVDMKLQNKNLGSVGKCFYYQSLWQNNGVSLPSQPYCQYVEADRQNGLCAPW